jgi:hypothetical protein
MESIDTHALIERTWDAISAMYQREGLSVELRALVSVCAEGYPFPTNLDRRVPETAGMAPESEQDILIKSLKKNETRQAVLDSLMTMRKDSMA